MSAIGDYIHRSNENYILYGTRRRGEGKNSWVDSYNAQLRKNAERINRLKNSDLNKTLKQLSELIKNESQKEEYKAQKEVEKSFEDGLDTIAENFRQKIISEVPTSLIYKKEAKSMPIRSEYINIEEAIAARRRIYENIDRINSMSGKAIPKSSLDTSIKNFNDFFYSLGSEKSFSDIQKVKITSKNTLGQLRDFVRKVQLSTVNNTAALHGEFGEQVVQACGAKMQELANEAITSTIVGNEKTSFSLEKDKVMKGVQPIIKAQDNYDIYTAHSSQNKIDVEIKIKDINIGASVKAYGAKGNTIRAHIQDIHNLLYSLAATQNEFANHWLNMHALTEYNKSNMEEMDKVLEDALRYEALSAGNLLKENTKEANTFIAIDVNSGRVYAKTAYDILTNEKSNFIFRPLISSISLAEYNVTQPTVEERIARILIGLRKYKISVLYRASFKNS